LFVVLTVNVLALNILTLTVVLTSVILLKRVLDSETYQLHRAVLECKRGGSRKALYNLYHQSNSLLIRGTILLGLSRPYAGGLVSLSSDEIELLLDVLYNYKEEGSDDAVLAACAAEALERASQPEAILALLNFLLLHNNRRTKYLVIDALKYSMLRIGKETPKGNGDITVVKKHILWYIKNRYHLPKQILPEGWDENKILLEFVEELRKDKNIATKYKNLLDKTEQEAKKALEEQKDAPQKPSK